MYISTRVAGALAILAVAIVAGMGWLFWPVSNQAYDWENTVSELIDGGECRTAMRLLRRLSITNTASAYDMWRTIRFEEGCGSGLLGVDPTEPLNPDEEFIVRFIEGRTWPQRSEPYGNLYFRPFPNQMPSIHEVVFYRRCGKTILSRVLSDEFAVREQVMEMELDTNLLSPWERRISFCADVAYYIAKAAFGQAASANSSEVRPLMSYAIDLAEWAGRQGHPGAIRLSAEYTLNRISLLLYNFCTEEMEASLPGEFWWTRENLRPFLETEGWAQRLYAEFWESGVLVPRNDELAYYWYLRASLNGETVGLDLLRVQWQLGDVAARLIEERMIGGEAPDEPRILFPVPSVGPDCDFS